MNYCWRLKSPFINAFSLLKVMFLKILLSIYFINARAILNHVATSDVLISIHIAILDVTAGYTAILKALLNVCDNCFNLTHAMFDE